MPFVVHGSSIHDGPAPLWLSIAACVCGAIASVLVVWMVIRGLVRAIATWLRQPSDPDVFWYRPRYPEPLGAEAPRPPSSTVTKAVGPRWGLVVWLIMTVGLCVDLGCTLTAKSEPSAWRLLIPCALWCATFVTLLAKEPAALPEARLRCRRSQDR